MRITWQSINTITFLSLDDDMLATIEMPTSVPMQVPIHGSLVTLKDKRDSITYRVTDRPHHYYYNANGVDVEVYVEPYL